MVGICGKYIAKIFRPPNSPSMFVIIGKTIISLLCAGLAGGLIAFREKIETGLKKYDDKTVLLGVWALTRLVPFFLIFVVFDQTPFSDLDGFFGQAREAVQLKLVYRDFYCMYSPLFPYVNAVGLWFWLDKKAIILVMILMEGGALWATNRFYRDQLSDRERLFRSLLYLLLPGSLVLCVLGGQEDVWMWLMLVVSYLLWQRTQRIEWFGVGLVVGFMFTKAVFILVGPALLFLVPKPVRWMAAAAIVGVVTLAVLYHFTGWLWLEQPLHEAATLRAPNWLSVTNPLTMNVLGAGAKRWNWLGLLLTTGVGALLAYRLRKQPFSSAFSAVYILIFGTMMIVQQSAYSNYIFIFLLPYVFNSLDLGNRLEVGLFLLFNCLCVIHPSLWWRLKSPYYHSISEIFTKPIYILDYALQLGIVLLTFYFLRKVWQKATDF